MARRRKITNYTCFRCGEPNDPILNDDVILGECHSCKEAGVISYQSALDILNDLYLKEIWDPEEIDNEEEEYEELDFNETIGI